MIVILEQQADIALTKSQLQALGLWTKSVSDGDLSALEIIPPSPTPDLAIIRALDGVSHVLGATAQHPLVDGQAGAVTAPRLIAGPCSVESPAQIEAAAAIVARCGASHLRGGAFKPRTSPYSFDGHGLDALRWMRAAADRYGLGVVTEALSEGTVEAVADTADIVQIGSRNMANFALLRAVGRTGASVLLKRGLAATIDEWILAGEHLLRSGAREVIFCERGIRSFDSETRFLLDLSAVAILAARGQAVVVDPSHAAGRRDLVAPLAKAAMAVGAQGLIIECHPDPGAALSDGPQAFRGHELASLSHELWGVSPTARVRTTEHS